LLHLLRGCGFMPSPAFHTLWPGTFCTVPTSTPFCNDPGITDADSEGEATLDAEWSNALAPSADLIFMSCDSSPDNCFVSSMAALVDENLADSIGLSWGFSELVAAL
jgi:subtilase family serine protease